MKQRKWIQVLLLVVLPFSLVPVVGEGATKVAVRDLVSVKGIRTNRLMGYGLVVGLSGTGDSRRFALTKKMMQNLLKNYGTEVQIQNSELRNSAAVVVSGELPPFVTPGSKIDLTVASIGDARSLRGGMLVQTPLYGNDQKIYGMGQGSVAIVKEGQGRLKQENRGVVVQGGIIEKDLSPNYIQQTRKGSKIVLLLDYQDFSLAQEIANAIKQEFNNVAITAANSRRLDLFIRSEEQANNTLSAIMSVEVNVDDRARVVIDEKSGVVVMGKKVKISPVAVSVDGLVWQEDKQEQDEVSLYYKSDKKKGNSIFFIEKTSTVQELVKKINDIGVDTKQLISILKAAYNAGAIQGKLIIN